jgi:carboxyl-terminal processing protease
MSRCLRRTLLPASSRFVLPVSFALALGLLLGLLGGCASGPTEADLAGETDQTLSARSRRLQMESFDTVYETVRERHWDEERVAEPWTAAYEALRPEVATVRSQAEARRLMNQLVASLGQSHFGIFPGPRDEEELVPLDAPRAVSELEVEVEAGAAVAAAAESGEDTVEEDVKAEGFPGFAAEFVDGHLMVTRVAANSPAARSGVQVGWEVLRARDRAASELVTRLAEREGEAYPELRSVRMAASFISGPRDSVTPMLFLDRQGRRRDVEIRMVAAEGADFRMGEQLSLPTRTEIRSLREGVGYYALSAFGNPAPVMREFGAMLQDHIDAPGVVIDLRNNPGGIGMMASGLAGFFVEERGQHLGQMITRGGGLKFVIFPRAETYPGKVAVLVNGASASTSEIFAAGLQDIGRARVFGNTTAGAVLPSHIITLPNGDGFQFATADFEAPSGTRLEGRGAIPDETVVHTVEALRRGEDRALEAALRWILSSNS